MIMAVKPRRQSSTISVIDTKSSLIKMRSAERPLWPEDVVATMYHHLGIRADQMFADPLGRPIPLLAEGEVIRELL